MKKFEFQKSALCRVGLAHPGGSDVESRGQSANCNAETVLMRAKSERQIQSRLCVAAAVQNEQCAVTAAVAAVAAWAATLGAKVINVEEKRMHCTVLHRYYRVNNNYLGRRGRTRYLNNYFRPTRKSHAKG